MASCDFNGACTCIRCRTKTFDVICPSCNFKNSVDVIGTGVIVAGRKGERFAEFTHPTDPKKELTCFKCKTSIENVDFYNEINTLSCEQELEEEKIIESATPCMSCGKRTFEKFGRIKPIKLSKHNNFWLCHCCLIEQLKSEKTDPSNENEKYEFDENAHQWVLQKVRIPCSSCGKPRWLNEENRWKEQCMKCYKKSLTN